VSDSVLKILRARSADGSEIGCELLGAGPPLLLVHGSIADRSRWYSVRDALAARFRLHLMDRRGRGLSANQAETPYAIAREGEDIKALIEAIDQPTLVLAHSYGGTCALEAAAGFDGMSKLLVYEPAFAPGGDPIFPYEALDEVEAALARGDRETAVMLFYSEALQLDAKSIALVRSTPIWHARLAAAGTLGREAHAANAYRLDPERMATISAPTRFLLGTETAAPLQRSTRYAHEAVPGSELADLPSQGHNAMDADPARFVAQVVDWLAPG
jgi:pimeloyl-ACP methyl ester carboxylesterase